jgi:glycosyltransferase involved in cell wall biosynthesis
MILGIDCSRIRSGGGVAHILGVLSNIDPVEFGITEVHIWAHHDLIAKFPAFPWLKRHSPRAINRGLLSQILWQAFWLSFDLKRMKCDILLSTFAGTFCRFAPSFVISHDMLCYEPGQLRRYGWTFSGLRLLVLLFVQNSAFRRSNGVIFLTHYAAKIIQKSTGILNNYRVIPHGVDERFRSLSRQILKKEYSLGDPIRCVYISTIAVYKNQDTVVSAISELRSRGYNISIEIIGPDDGTGNIFLYDKIQSVDPSGVFVKCLGSIPHSKLPQLVSDADFFIFASSCENMPVTLIEGMALGLPIVCSRSGPMPEVLQNGGVYFDPRSPDSLVSALEKLINENILRSACIQSAQQIARAFSWERTARETFTYISDTVKSLR